MLSKFAEGLGGKLADNWAATILTPAFAFWALGLTLLALRIGWAPLLGWLTQPDRPFSLALLVSTLLLVVASGTLMQGFAFGTLRFLEGYWPAWMGGLRERFTEGHERRREHLQQEFERLAQRSEQWEPVVTRLSREERRQRVWYAEATERLRRYPPIPEPCLPTVLGNVLRAAELAPRAKYGLSSVVCWPRLWLVLPDGSRNELMTARTALNAAALNWVWSLLLLVWLGLLFVPAAHPAVWRTILGYMPLALAALGMTYFYTAIVRAANIYGELVESAFDVHRKALYEALRLPVPPDPANENTAGEQLTNLLR